jgi:hypothetical protein
MSVLTTITDLADELEDPGVVSSIQKHVADGCPLAPLVECVTPQYDHEDRARVIAAMVERAREVIAHQNEHAANDASSELIHTCGESPKPRQGRPKSEERAVRKMAAKLAGVSEETVRRHQKAEEPEPIAPKPPKPKAVPERLAALVPGLTEINGVLAKIRKSMDAAAQQFKWAHSDIRWKLLQDLGRANAGVANAMMIVGDVSERMHRANIQQFTAPVSAPGEKPVRGPNHDTRRDEEKAARIAKGGGLKAPKRKLDVRISDGAGGEVPMAAVEETVNAWADAAKVGVGPDEESPF